METREVVDQLIKQALELLRDPDQEGHWRPLVTGEGIDDSVTGAVDIVVQGYTRNSWPEQPFQPTDPETARAYDSRCGTEALFTEALARVVHHELATTRW